MPIDFARVPPRVVVPEPPRLSMLVAALTLGIVLSAGAALAIFVWPAGRPMNTPWFRFCVLGYPLLAWVFLICGYFAASYMRRIEAIATNRVSDGEELKLHTLASEPLAVLAYGWAFSSDNEENGAEGVLDGTAKMRARPSLAEPGIEINARWLEIPDRPFYAGNELTEYARHHAICDWLLDKLIDSISNGLATLPVGTSLHVDLDLSASIEAAIATTRLEELLSVKVPALRVSVSATEEQRPLLTPDLRRDIMKPNQARLLIAIQLRNAVSERLRDGVAEVGVALLLGREDMAREASATTNRLCIHRPSTGSPDTVRKTLELAARWGRTDLTQIKAVWSHALSAESMLSVKTLSQFGEGTRWIDLDATVGHCDGASGWLAVALATECAALTDAPQLVLTCEGSDMTALVCRRQA